MKALVTGGAGFIGSHTVDLLLERGYDVKVLDALVPPVHIAGVKPKYVPPEVEFIQGDIRDKGAMVQALEGTDVVFHFAAYQDYMPDFSKFAMTNDGGTALLYEVILEKKYPVHKVVVASSQAIYGEGKYICAEHGTQYPDPRPEAQLLQRQWEPLCANCRQPMTPQWTDESQVNPANQYAISKYAQELYALILGRRYGIPTVTMRYSITQGPRQSLRNAYSGILRSFTQRLLNGLRPIVYEDGNQIRDYVWVGDVARANLLVLEDERANYQAFNVGGNRRVTVLEYADLLINKIGANVKSEIAGKFRFGDTRHIFSDIGKLRALGWEPTMRLDQIAEAYIDWAAARPDLEDHTADALRAMEKVGTIRSTVA